MISSLSDHPLPGELRAFGHGLLEPDAAARVEKHLSTCDTCCQTLEQDSGDQFLDRLRLARNQAELDGGRDPLASNKRESYSATITSPGRGTDAQSNELGVPSGWEMHPGYRIEGLIESGGMGVVYKAVQIRLNRAVALKMVIGGTRAQPKRLIRFLAEAEALAAVHHPNVVEVYEYGEHDGRPFLALEYLSGGTLSDRLTKKVPGEPKAAAALIGTLANAVQAAHHLGIVHRDLKPANVLFDSAGQPKVTDFGLAKRVGSDLTQNREIMGTPAYMAPEQAKGDTKFVGPQADVYSLGVILYEHLTGVRPFDDEDPNVLLRKVAEEEPLRPGQRVPGLPRDIELICLKCLEKDPSERYPTARELAEDLKRFTAGEPVSVRLAGPVERVAKWARRKPTVAAAYGLTVAVVVLVGFGSVVATLWRMAASDSVAAKEARDGERRFRTDAETARDDLRAAQDRLEAVEYGKAMQVAYQEWHDNNIAATLAILKSTRPDLRGWEWGFLYRLCHSELYTLTCPNDTVRSAAFRADGTQIVTAGSDGVARLWDVKTRIPEIIHNGQIGRLHSAALSPDGSQVAVADGGIVQLYSTSTRADVKSLGEHTADIWSVTYSPDGTRIVTASEDKTAKIWDAMSGNRICDLAGHTARIVNAAFDLKGTRVVTASWDKTAKIWDAKTGEILHKLEGHTDEVHSVAFSPDGAQVVSGCKDGSVKVWNASNGQEEFTFKAHATPVTSIAFSRKSGGTNRIVTAGSLDNTAKVWDAHSRALLLTLKGHTGAVSSVAFSSDGSQVLTGSHDGTARVWDVWQRGEESTLRGSGEPIKWVAFSGDGSRVFCSTESKPENRMVAGASAKLSLQNRLQNIQALFGQERNGPVNGAWDGAVKAWKVKTMTEASIVTRPADTTEVLAAWFGPDYHRVVTKEGWFPKLLDGKTGEEIKVFTAHSGPVSAVAFSTDGKWLVTGALDNTARVWDAETGKPGYELEGHPDLVRAVTFSPDGTRILVGCGDGSVKVWDAKTGKEVLTLKGHSAAITSVSLNSDGTRIVTTSKDRSAKVWDAKTGVDVLTLRGHGSVVHSAAFSPDGTQIVTGGEDGTARIWESLRAVPPPLPPLLPPPGSPPDPIPPGLIAYQGVWRCVLFGVFGEPQLVSEDGPLACVEGRRVQFWVNGKGQSAFDLRVDVRSNPKQIDLYLGQEHLPAVYEIQGDFLILAARHDGKRPERMPTGEGQKEALNIVVYHKISPDGRTRPTKSNEIAGWTLEQAADENLKVYQGLEEVKRPGFARAVLRGLADKDKKFANTKAGVAAAQLLKSPK